MLASYRDFKEIITKYLSKDSAETYLNNSLRSIGKSLGIKELKKDYAINNFFWRKLNTSDKYVNVIDSLLELEETCKKLLENIIKNKITFLKKILIYGLKILMKNFKR